MLAAVCLLIGLILLLRAIFLWFKGHIYQVIQDLSGNTRAKQVSYLKNNSMFMSTKIHSQKVENLNELIESYLHHGAMQSTVSTTTYVTTEHIYSPKGNDITVASSTGERMEQWKLYPVLNESVTLEEQKDTPPITEVLHSDEVIGQDGELLHRLFQNRSAPYDQIILPMRKEKVFQVVRSNIVVHWSSHQ